ncbi:MAG: TolC family protein, partial [Leptospira sp.]|nr:TolC family protein [Leptospira sp.]
TIEKSGEEPAINRYDVLAAAENMKVADANLKKAWAGHLPTVTLNNYWSFPQQGTNHTDNITIQLQANLPLISAGTVTASIRQAESVKRQAELLFSQTKRQASEDIRKAKDSRANSARLLILYEKSRNSAERNLEEQKSNYRYKSVSRLDLFLTEISLISSEIAYKRAFYQNFLNSTWYGVAIGDLPKFNSPIDSEKNGG